MEMDLHLKSMRVPVHGLIYLSGTDCEFVVINTALNCNRGFAYHGFFHYRKTIKSSGTPKSKLPKWLSELDNRPHGKFQSCKRRRAVPEKA